MNLRRRPLVANAVALMVAPRMAHSQPTGKVWQIGSLTLYPRPLPPQPPSPIFDASDLEMRRQGFAEGQVVVHERNWGGKPELLAAMTRELVGLRIDVLMAHDNLSALAAKQVAGSIPVLFTAVTDPVGKGLVQSLARPGGNMTGTTFDVEPAMYGKYVALLKQISPSLSRVAVLFDVSGTAGFEHLLDAAKGLGVDVRTLPIRAEKDYAAAFAAMKEQHVDGILVGGVVNFVHRNRVVALAAENRLPALYVAYLYSIAGGLITYHPDTIDMARRSAAQLAKILKGAKPSDIPVEQPTKFRLVINLTAAKALGLSVPQSLLLRADEVIQ